MKAFNKLVVVYDGDLAQDISSQIKATHEASSLDLMPVELRKASDRPKSLLDLNEGTLVCFVMQTIENGSPTEDGGMTLRFFNRKTHPATLLQNDSFSFCVLGLGDSNLLLDRQTTTAKDCNQVAQTLDKRLETLGGNRFF